MDNLNCTILNDTRSADEWNEITDALPKGYIAVDESNTSKIKVGNGRYRYSALPYVGISDQFGNDYVSEEVSLSVPFQKDDLTAEYKYVKLLQIPAYNPATTPLYSKINIINSKRIGTISLIFDYDMIHTGIFKYSSDSNLSNNASINSDPGANDVYIYGMFWYESDGMYNIYIKYQTASSITNTINESVKVQVFTRNKKLDTSLITSDYDTNPDTTKVWKYITDRLSSELDNYYNKSYIDTQILHNYKTYAGSINVPTESDDKYVKLCEITCANNGDYNSTELWIVNGNNFAYTQKLNVSMSRNVEGAIYYDVTVSNVARSYVCYDFYYRLAGNTLTIYLKNITSYYSSIKVFYVTNNSSTLSTNMTTVATSGVTVTGSIFPDIYNVPVNYNTSVVDASNTWMVLQYNRPTHLLHICGYITFKAGMSHNTNAIFSKYHKMNFLGKYTPNFAIKDIENNAKYGLYAAASGRWINTMNTSGASLSTATTMYFDRTVIASLE